MLNFPHHIRAKMSMIAFSRGSVKFYDVINIEHQVFWKPKIRAKWGKRTILYCLLLCPLLDIPIGLILSVHGIQVKRGK